MELKAEKKTDGQTYNRTKSDQGSAGHKHEVGQDFVGSGYYPPERFVPLLARFSHPANATQRVQVFNQLQRQYGNRYVQKVVSAYRSENGEEEESTIVSEQTYVVQQNGEKVQRKFMVGKNDQNINQNKPQRAAMSRSRFRANEHPLPEMQQSTTGHAVLRRYESDKERRSSNSTLPGLTTEWRTGSPSVEKSIPVSSLDLQIRNQVEASHGSGHQLAPDLRFVAERQLKSNLSDVRIHIGKRADVLAQDLSALGFTLGANVFLSSQATHKPEIMTHELRHAAQRDRTRLHFWARPQQAAAYATRLSTTLRRVSLPPRFSYDTLETTTLAPLFQRANPQHPQFGSRSQELVRWFFQGYGGDGAENEQAGVQAFLNDLASCLERMADAGRLTEATSYGPREQRRAARHLYLRNLERIELSGYTGLQDLARARADQIFATERLAEHRREEEAGEEERERAKQRWIEFWTRYFGREDLAFAPFALWMLRHWDTVRTDSDIQTLRWVPLTNSREYRQSFDVVLGRMPANIGEREYLEERDDYFSSVCDTFHSAVERTRELMSSFVESYTSWVSIGGILIDRPRPTDELRSQVEAWIHIRSWSLRREHALPEPFNQWIRYWDSIIRYRAPRGLGVSDILEEAGLRGVT